MKPCHFWTATALLTAVRLSAAPMLVFIGTYTNTTSRGIYALRLDPAGGVLSAPWLAAEAQESDISGPRSRTPPPLLDG